MSETKTECVLCGRTDRECVPVVGRTGVTQMMCGGDKGCAGPVLERLRKTKECVDCGAVLTHWWVCDLGDPYCAKCWSAIPGAWCDGCSHDDCRICHEDESQCCGCGAWVCDADDFGNNEEVEETCCEECWDRHLQTADCRCETCGDCIDVSASCLHEKPCLCEDEEEDEEEDE